MFSDKPELDDVLRTIATTTDQYFTAGGAALYAKIGTSYNDIDIYFRSEEAYDSTISVLHKYSDRIVNTPNSISIHTDSVMVQLINHTFGTPEEVLSDFDLDCCKVAKLPNGDIYTHKDFKTKPVVNYSQITPQIFNRVFKYSVRLKVEPDIKDLVDHVVNNLDTEIPVGYSNQKTTMSKTLETAKLDHTNATALLRELDKLEDRKALDVSLSFFVDRHVAIALQDSEVSSYLQARVAEKAQIQPSEVAKTDYPELFI